MLVDQDTELEISERVAYWELVYQAELKERQLRGYGESTAKALAKMHADSLYVRRFPEDYN